MKVTFFSNFLNHHQLPFCEEMQNLLGDNFKFVATQKIPEERIKLGYEDMNEKYSFVVREYDNMSEAIKLAKESDIIILGSAPAKYIKMREKMRKISFRYSERIFKEGFNIKKWILLIKNHAFVERRFTYLLSASAYAASDYNLAFAYKNKTFKWGYFPALIKYKDINKIIENKKENSILWVARFLDWKHPEIVVNIGKMLKKDGCNFIINMIGIGPEYDRIRLLIKNNNLEKEIKLLGCMSPDDVRCYMEKSQIFLFTSDRNEGWGAVLNEAMNSACAVVASHAIGSVPFLIDNYKNGIIYEDGNIDDLYYKVKFLLDNYKMTSILGIRAYSTMINLWNSKLAARRFIELSRELLDNKSITNYKNGPCSKAELLNDNWYKTERS